MFFCAFHSCTASVVQAAKLVAWCAPHWYILKHIFLLNIKTYIQLFYDYTLHPFTLKNITKLQPWHAPHFYTLGFVGLYLKTSLLH